MSKLRKFQKVDTRKKWLISFLVPLAVLSQGFSNNKANAEDIYAPVPTLTKLHDAGETIPNTDPPVVYPQSAYSISEGTSSDYNFTTTSYDNSGNLTTNYYKINLDLNGISPDGLTWSEASGEGDNTVEVNLPNNETKYYQYTYKLSDNYIIDRSQGGLIITNINSTDVDKNFYFIGNSSQYVNTNNVNKIIGDFVNNTSIVHDTSSYGGAIYNVGTINNIVGIFAGNSNLSTTSTSRTEKAFGGAIANYANSGTSSINFIVGHFVGNSSKVTGSGTHAAAFGGAIGNGGDYSTSNAFIGSIIGDFVDNTTYSRVSFSYGGAIANYSYSGATSIIDSIVGDFIGNYSYSRDYKSYGGAIYNNGQINILNSSFYNNYAKADIYTARGGAVYNSGTVNIIADNGKSEFRGNYTNTNGTINDNAIFLDGAGAVVTLKAQNNGEIFMYDNIKGTEDSNIVMTGDTSGIIHLYNDVAGPNITTDTVTIDMANNDIHDYNFTSLKSDPSTKYNIDVDLTENGSSDTITVNNNSESTVTLNDLNVMNQNSATQDNYTIQVLNTNNDYTQLALGDDLANKEIVLRNTEFQNVEDEVTKDAKWNDRFEKYTLNTSVVGNVTLDTTTTTNDSIKLTATGTQTTKTDNVSLGDTLALVNQLDTAEDRSFTFDTANDKYNATSDLGTTTAGKLGINGEVLRSAQNDVIARSEINLNGHNGFELDNATTLNVNDTRLTGNDTLITVNNQNAIVNLQNADLNGSIASENSYTLNITGDTSDRTIINGGVGKANATHNGGELGFNTDTFKDAEFSTTAGTVDLVTGQVENYDIGKLTSDESTNWIFEVNADGSGADTLTVGTGSSGTVNVSEINFVNGDSPSDEFTVQLLNAEDDNIQLAVDPSISGENHKLGTVTKTSQDTVTPTAKWNQTFNKYTQNGTNYGNIDVATTNTTNDSLQLQITSTEWDDKVVSGSMGDTLALVNQLETEEDRNFNFDTSNDVYEVKSDLGTTSAGVMNVNGILRSAQNDGSGQAERSTINGNNYNMFALSNPTTLNLNNVKIQGANSVASGTNKSAIINMNNVELKNNASGITTAGSVNISGKSVFENNGNGIEVTDEDSIITLNGLDGDGYDVVFKDKLKGVSGAKLNLKAGQVEFHKSVTDLDINMDGTTANLKADNVFNGQNLTVASASDISMINNSVGTMQLNSLVLNDNMNLGVDVDLANKSMDRISANTYNLGDHKVNVNKMNLLSDAKEVRTDIEFADEGLRNNVTTSVSEVAYSPIYKYGVKYDQDNGEFQFTRSNSGGGGGNTPGGGGSGGNSGGGYRPTYNDLNPAIMASPVAAQMGGYAGMLDNYGNALNHMDMFMLKPHHMRKAELNANKYAIADGSNGTYISNETNTTGIWVRPYTSYDSVNMKHGPKVNNLSYGSFIGGDFGMHDFGNGLYGEFSPYISYQGAHQHYSGNSVYQNGGSLGFTGTLYKGNFFTGLTAGVGANVTEASTMYGNEDFPMLSTGVASKTGYNIEFKDGKFIIQPSLLVSYTFVNTFDYKNGAGVRIDTAPLHAVQINPNIRFSFNTKNYWQPYAFVGMNWNIMESGHFKAADTTLPELSVKPYVQYGLGIQKLFSDNFTAFAQVAVRNGGRNGVGGTLGMKWILGGQPQKQQEPKPKNVL